MANEDGKLKGSNSSKQRSFLPDNWRELLEESLRKTGIIHSKQKFSVVRHLYGTSIKPGSKIKNLPLKVLKSFTPSTKLKISDLFNELLEIRSGSSKIPDFTITIDPTLSPQQAKKALKALAEYYRACGGSGFIVKVEEVK
ncbi:MAG TPA: hypothetical protein VFB76_17205 [Candidatus Angelobacter sp.]|nr:hypothetical protein [Candidatus Angelobacter sp.]